VTLMTQQEEVSVIARLAFGLTIALVLWSRAALALTGNELLKRCEDNDAVQRAFCVGYVIGVADMVEEGPSGLICVATGVSNGQLSDIVVKFLRDHPERRQLQRKQPRRCCANGNLSLPGRAGRATQIALQCGLRTCTQGARQDRPTCVRTSCSTSG